jgi:3-oxoacyl-[acyl-carrier-protein] synthase-3
MIGIAAVRSYLPETIVDHLQESKRFDVEESFVREKLGVVSSRVMAPGQDSSDLAFNAMQALCKDGNLKLEEVDAIVVVTQNPDGNGLPHTSAVLHQKLGLSANVAAFDISLGCSGYVYGLSILRGLMNEASLKNGVLVTCDPYSKIVDRDDKNTCLLFGDAATATWLSDSGPWKLGAPILATDGRGSSNLAVSNNKLQMNGRQVFNFASIQAPRQISEWLSKNNLKPGDIDVFCMHQGSKFIVDTIAGKFPGVEKRFLVDLEHTGNTVSSSIPLLLEKHVLSSSSKTVLMTGFGVGLSWATNGLFFKG